MNSSLRSAKTRTAIASSTAARAINYRVISSGITYYPIFERWQIVKESGATSSYGGGVQTTTQGLNTSAGNSIQWGVKWGNWIGGSSVTKGQSQYATAWYLNWTADRWGDRVTYAYDGWPNQAADDWMRDQQTGLIPDVEQLVGFGQTTQPTDIHPGALKGITYPTGAIANYSYQQQSLPICAPPRIYRCPRHFGELDTSGVLRPRLRGNALVQQQRRPAIDDRLYLDWPVAGMAARKRRHDLQRSTGTGYKPTTSNNDR
jgi:hypothetical protein